MKYLSINQELASTKRKLEFCLWSSSFRDDLLNKSNKKINELLIEIDEHKKQKFWQHIKTWWEHRSNK